MLPFMAVQIWIAQHWRSSMHTLFPTFPPYFDDLKECCHELCHLFFSQAENIKDVTHDQMIVILQRTLDALLSQPGIKDKLVASSLDGSAASSSGDCCSMVQWEADKEDLMMGSKDVEMEMEYEDDISLETKEEESVSGEDNESMGDKDDESKGSNQSGNENMMPNFAPGVYCPAFQLHSASPSIHAATNGWNGGDYRQFMQ